MTKTTISSENALLQGAMPSANVFEATVERIGQSIKLGLIKPGQQLPPERELAELIGVSRVTVRAAIQVLTQGGFLTSKRGRNGGTFVVDVPPIWKGTGAPGREVSGGATNAYDISDYRRVLETGICELAAERITEQQLSALRARVGQLSEHIAERDAFRAEDAQFHIAIAEATGSQRLVRMVAEIQAELGDLITHIPPSEAALVHSNLQHARIVAALAKRDGTAARKVMEEHISGTSRFLLGLLPDRLEEP